ncbi:MAG: ferrous iron transport protein B [Flavobacteriales bacterium]|nr:MAG: ferrous iron transport protein B [Flavobacteriales bacterium]
MQKTLKSLSNKDPQNIILIGNPNTGKTTLFNSLTGLNQKVGNFPGVTVDKKTGNFNYKETKINVVDLPGTYSLSPNSEDERIAKSYLEETNQNDIIVVVADATNLKRNLLLFTQIVDLGKQVILVLNMMDLLQKNTQEIDFKKLSKKLNCPIIPINARLDKGVEKLKEAVFSYQQKENIFLDSDSSSSSIDETMKRVGKINTIVDDCLTKDGEDKSYLFTKKIDNIVTHKIYGYLIFLGILFFIFQAIFSWASYPMDLIDSGFGFLCDFVSNILPKGILNDLIVNGILAGLGGIVIFVPQIAILFAFITILEDTGYMSRVSFLMDRILRQFGLNGKSIIPIISSTACAIPAIMGARTISNYKERLITIMVAPLISCSARIPVYTILIALIVSEEETYGIFNLQGLLVMGLYLLGFVAAILSAWVMKLIIKSKQKSTFTLEMPIYRTPRWKNVGFEILSKVKIFLFDAGKIIIAISIVLWVLSSYAPGNKFEDISKKYTSETSQQQYSEQEISTLIASERLEHSYAGIIGKIIEPTIKPLGFDWKIGISLVTSFAAREVFVGTMATLYSVGDADNTMSIREKMMAAKNHETGEKLYTTATTLSLLIFYVFAMQCMATLAVVYRETNSIKWPIIQVVYMGALAYFSSLLVYSIFS